MKLPAVFITLGLTIIAGFVYAACADKRDAIRVERNGQAQDMSVGVMSAAVLVFLILAGFAIFDAIPRGWQVVIR